MIENDWSDLEFFGSNTKACLKITKRGIIYLNYPFVLENKEKIHDKEYISVAYSNKMRALVFEFHNKINHNKSYKSIKISSPKGGSLFFNISTILKNNNITPVPGRYFPKFELINEKEFLVLRLDDTNGSKK